MDKQMEADRERLGTALDDARQFVRDAIERVTDGAYGDTSLGGVRDTAHDILTVTLRQLAELSL